MVTINKNKRKKACKSQKPIIFKKISQPETYCKQKFPVDDENPIVYQKLAVLSQTPIAVDQKSTQDQIFCGASKPDCE